MLLPFIHFCSCRE